MVSFAHRNENGERNGPQSIAAQGEDHKLRSAPQGRRGSAQHIADNIPVSPYIVPRLRAVRDVHAESDRDPARHRHGPGREEAAMSNSNGGYAFPRTPGNKQVAGTSHTSYDSGSNGMSLRDWFAGQALAGLCVGDDDLHAVALVAYNVADMMLKERAK